MYRIFQTVPLLKKKKKPVNGGMHNRIFSCGYFLIIRGIPLSREILNTNQSTLTH